MKTEDKMELIKFWMEDVRGCDEVRASHKDLLSVQNYLCVRISLQYLIVFGPTLTLVLLIFGKSEIGKLCVLKKDGLSIFEEICP